MSRRWSLQHIRTEEKPENSIEVYQNIRDTVGCRLDSEMGGPVNNILALFYCAVNDDLFARKVVQMKNC